MRHHNLLYNRTILCKYCRFTCTCRSLLNNEHFTRQLINGIWNCLRVCKDDIYSVVLYSPNSPEYWKIVGQCLHPDYMTSQRPDFMTQTPFKDAFFGCLWQIKIAFGVIPLFGTPKDTLYSRLNNVMHVIDRPTDRVRRKKKIVQVLGGKLCGKKRRLCGIVQSSKQTNIRSPGPPKKPNMVEFLDKRKLQQLPSQFGN